MKSEWKKNEETVMDVYEIHGAHCFIWLEQRPIY